MIKKTKELSPVGKMPAVPETRIKSANKYTLKRERAPVKVKIISNLLS